MCGRFSQFSPVSDLVSRFAVDETLVDPAAIRPRYNLAPTQQALVIAASSDGTSRRMGTMRWGLVPRWASDIGIGNKMINARTDRVATSNAYRSAFAKRRCLIPADGFFEWAAPSATTPGTKPVKTPYHIHAIAGVPLALAGLWETWNDAEGRPLRTFTILTTDANATMAGIHHRMPVIISDADWAVWLAPEPLDSEERIRLLAPASDDLLVCDAVSTAVNRPVNDSPDVIVPV